MSGSGALTGSIAIGTSDRPRQTRRGLHQATRGLRAAVRISATIAIVAATASPRAAPTRRIRQREILASGRLFPRRILEVRKHSFANRLPVFLWHGWQSERTRCQAGEQRRSQVVE